MINNDSTIKIYITSSKPFYYPGENFEANILLDVLDKTKCDKMQIIAKGKEFVEAIQKTYVCSYGDSELEEYSNESDESNQNKRGKIYDKDDVSSEENVKDNSSIARNLNEIHEIFKFKKILKISNYNYIDKGKYTFPFEVEIPKDIPGSFLFLDKNTYVEIIYTLKVKLNIININESIPIVIRQKIKTFNYPTENQFTKKIMGCCFDNNESTIILSINDKGNKEKYMINLNKINLNVTLNNSQCDIKGTAVNIELYQKLTVFPNRKDKKLKVTKIVGKYEGKRNLHPRENLSLNISFEMDRADYASRNLKKTNSIKYFRHKDIIPFLNQSIKSEFILCEYEAYAEVQFPNWTVEELGVFLPIVIYPPEKGIVSKTVMKKSEEFLNSIVKKKVFLSHKTKDEDPEFWYKNKRKSYKKNIYYENSDSEEEYNKKVGKRVSLLKVKSFGFKETNNKGNDTESNEKKSNNSKDEDINDNINNNLNINNYKNNNYINDRNENIINDDKNNVMNEDGSFGTYERRKKNIVYIDTNSNNIKKEFTQAYLNDALDDEFLDNASSQ